LIPPVSALRIGRVSGENGPTGEALRPPVSRGLLTDFYELTMAHAYWREGVHRQPAIFELFFRHVPFGGGFAVACGLATVAGRLAGFGFDASDVAYLAGLRAAGADAVLEFGLRRAQGADGALAASRAAFVGGADATSNVLAGRRFGIPVRGTHAHSFVM
jgi:nicotinic acid phosphoribosyltransferase